MNHRNSFDVAKSSYLIPGVLVKNEHDDILGTERNCKMTFINHKIRHVILFLLDYVGTKNGQNHYHLSDKGFL